MVSVAEHTLARAEKMKRIVPLLDPKMPFVWHDGRLDFLTEAIRQETRIVDTENVSALGYDADMLALIEKHRDGLVLDCGAGSKSDCYPNIVNLEIVAYPSTDVLAVGEYLPFATGSFDAVMSVAVLEHVRDPFRCAAEIVRVLKPGGDLLCAVPFLQPVHGYPHHYFNATPQGLRRLFEDSVEDLALSVPPACHPVHALNWILASWAAGLPPDTREEFLTMRVSDLLRPAWSMLEAPFARDLPEPKLFELACGTMLVGRKMPAPAIQHADPVARPPAVPEIFRRVLSGLRRRLSMPPARQPAPQPTSQPSNGFDEAAYLAANADVRAAVAAGLAASGAAHYAAFGKSEGRPLRLRVARTIAELDREVDRLREIEQRSMSEWLRARAGLTFEEDVAALPADPFSEAYREAQLSLYCLLSGRESYHAPTAEAYAMPVEKYVDPTPYPFSSRDGGLIGSHLVAVGHIMQTIWQRRPEPGLSILEYGCGTGVTTVSLAASGYQVTAVDINPDMLKVVDTIARDRRLSIRTHRGEFGAVPIEGERYDIVLFYEAFHHCLDFEALLRRLHDLLAPGGLLVLAGEPIFADFPKPWGLRLDGPALYDIRRAGWLELGFQEDFFRTLMSRTGWRFDKLTRPPAPDLFIATPA